MEIGNFVVPDRKKLRVSCLGASPVVNMCEGMATIWCRGTHGGDVHEAKAIQMAGGALEQHVLCSVCASCPAPWPAAVFKASPPLRHCRVGTGLSWGPALLAAAARRQLQRIAAKVLISPPVAAIAEAVWSLSVLAPHAHWDDAVPCAWCLCRHLLLALLGWRGWQCPRRLALRDAGTPALPRIRCAFSSPSCCARVAASCCARAAASSSALAAASCCARAVASCCARAAASSSALACACMETVLGHIMHDGYK
jgi:hypothetical protein